jgi:c(7)-type cytochrome triheme protein
VTNRVINAAVFGYFALFAVLVLLLGFRWNTQRKAPEQPIPFSHEIHVGKLNLDCLVCHQTADKSYFAGVPPMSKCMECHVAVRTETAGVQELTRYWNNKEPIPWNRVYRIRIRNHVYFSHERHIKADIKCEQCHGWLKAMTEVRAVTSLKMGWCVSCHAANQAPTDCTICHK